MSLNIALKRIRKAINTGATTLDLSSLELQKIPSQISKLKDLRNLSMEYNNISRIEHLEELTNLKKLILGHNNISKMRGFDGLTELRFLDVSFNQINQIEGLNKLKNLEDLDFFSNQITSIIELETLPNPDRLKILNLGSNELKDLKGLSQFSGLNELRLHYSHLSDLNSLEKLKNIKILTLHGNQLSDFPKFLLDLNRPIIWELEGQTKAISVSENPWVNPPPEIIKQGNDAIEEYFQQKEESGEERLFEAKLILLGDGRSGKTSLANRLLGKELPEEKDRTEGVDIIIGDYSFSLGNEKDFKLNIWDFAGQDKYKTLHQLFYTESSLYVMVAESGNTAVDFDDWFQTAALFGEGSPLVIVLNEFKDGIGMGSFDPTHWKKQFPNLIKEALTCNLLTKTNFSKIESAIQYWAQELPHTQFSFPKNWAKIRNLLNERRDEQFITKKQYLQICSDNNLPDRKSALILSSVLHTVGDCLHYQKSDLLQQFVILKNEWATEAVYKILEDKEVAEIKRGFFDENDLMRIWSHEDFRDMRPQLLELMKQFKLAYQLPGKSEYVTPPLLPAGRPESYTWPEAEHLELYIAYDFLPKALLTQFIVSRHIDIAEERTLVWRNGVVLEWPNEAYAEITKSKLHGRNAIHIRSQGTNRKGMMTVILKTFRELNSEYKGIKFDEKVPCICNGCRSRKNEQHYFNFEDLNFRLQKGKFKVECDKSLDDQNVLELLENSFLFRKTNKGEPLLLEDTPENQDKQGIKVLKMFLASSSELKPEREKIETALSRRNNTLRKQGFFIELLTWEDSKYEKYFRSQDNYNLAIDDCNFFAMLVHSKVGKFSNEEFNQAKNRFNEEKHPFIQIFEKDADIPKNQSKEEALSRFDFLEQLREEDHFPKTFKNPDQLIQKLEDTIDNLLADEDFVQRLDEE
ncbi:MAG: COR domain-containing protein [Bacteroidota bacterium]